MLKLTQKGRGLQSKICSKKKNCLQLLANEREKFSYLQWDDFEYLHHSLGYFPCSGVLSLSKEKRKKYTFLVGFVAVALAFIKERKRKNMKLDW